MSQFQLYHDDEGHVRLPEERDISLANELSCYDYYILLMNMLYYVNHCKAHNIEYDKFETSTKIFMCKNAFELKLRLLMSGLEVDPIDTMIKMYDMKEGANLKKYYNVIPGHLSEDGQPKVLVDSMKESFDTMQD